MEPAGQDGVENGLGASFEFGDRGALLERIDESLVIVRSAMELDGDGHDRPGERFSVGGTPYSGTCATLSVRRSQKPRLEKRRYRNPYPTNYCLNLPS